MYHSWKLRLRRTCLQWLVIAGVLVSAWAHTASPEAVFGERGMVASRSMLASSVGADILAAGGTAVDATVAVGFALAVTYPSAGNLGGGGFMVIRLADGSIATNDHRERAPLAATRDMFLDGDGNVVRERALASHLAVGVPGTVAGLLDVQEHYGSLPRKAVLDPAIRLASKGFALPRDMAMQFNRRREEFVRHPASLKKFSRADGKPWRAGDVFRQPDLARTLKRIRTSGKAGFYEGSTADLLVADMQSGGGLITHADLEQYQSVWREPVRGQYRGHEIVSMAPPSSGGVLLVQMLNMLEPLDIGAMGYGSADAIHAIIEAERRAYADRAEYLGDPDFYPVPVEKLTSKSYAKARFADFDPKRATLSADVGAGVVVPEGMNTTHVSVMDEAGNAVAYTTTLNLSYGSKIVAAGTGMLLNNEMDDFSAKENEPNFFEVIGRAANAIAPGKRMLSSMTPTIVLKNGEPLLVTGSPGGSTIITTVLQVVVNVIDHGMSVSDAVGQPRFHHQWLPDRVIYERFALSPDTRAILASRGHTSLLPFPFGRGIGDANSVMKTADGLAGSSDPRNDGGAVGVNR